MHLTRVRWMVSITVKEAICATKVISIEYLLNSAVFFFLKNILMHGPPGTGKTLLAKAVACESDAKLFLVSPSAVNRRYLGETESIISALFTMVSIVAQRCTCVKKNFFMAYHVKTYKDCLNKATFHIFIQTNNKSKQSISYG